MVTIHGTLGDDTLLGSDAESGSLFGDLGNDTLRGGSRADFLSGNQGNDFVVGGDGGDTIYGGKGDDTLYGGNNVDIATIESGVVGVRDSALNDADVIYGDLGNDVIQGNTGRDTLFGGDGIDVINGGRDADSIECGVGNDSIMGDRGDDTLQGNAGNDVLQGGTGNDLIRGGQGDDILIGGDGQDTLYGDLSGPNGDTIFTGNGDDVVIIRLNDASPVIGLRTPHALQSNAQTTITDFNLGDRIIFEGATSSNITISNSSQSTQNNPSTIIEIAGQSFVLSGVTANQISTNNITQGKEVVFGTGSNNSGGGGGGGGGAPAAVAPTNTLPATYTTNEDASVVLSGISVADSDTPTPASFTISTTNGILNILDNLASGITAGQIAGNGTTTITITGATLTEINNTLLDANGLTFVPTADYNGSATVTVTTNDGALTDTDTSTITINAINDAPVLSDVSASTAYTQNATAVAIDASATIADADDTDIESATVAITAGGDFVAAGGIDTLNYSTLHGVTGSYDANTGILTLTGSATKAQYEQILESVTFSSTSATSGNRTISFTLNDGTDNSNTQTATINYSLAPTLTGILTDQNTAANQAASAWTFDASTAFGGGGTYSLTTTDQLGNAVTGYSINSNTGIITNTSTIANTTTAYIFTVTKTNGATSVSETFDLFTNAGALTGVSTTGNDTITDNTASVRIWGDSGNDSITEGNLNVTIHGGDGNDTIVAFQGGGHILYGGAGTDSITGGSQANTLYGGSGSDTLIGAAGADLLHGGTGIDYFAFTNPTDSSAVSSDTINDFSQSEGDIINIRNGFDKVYAGTGVAATDSIIGGIEVGNLVWYQSGGNTFVYDPFSTNSTFSIRINGLFTLTNADFVFGGATPALTGTTGSDTITDNSTPVAIAGLAGNDSITEGNLNSTINGGDGNDTILAFQSGGHILYGGAGTDSITGGSQANTLYGGSGSDTLIGAGGADAIYGGTGADYFAYTNPTDSSVAGSDTIIDFSQSEGDIINLRNGFDKVYAGTGVAATDSIIGGIEVGNLVWYQSGGNTFVYDPFSANSTFSIRINGLFTLTNSDFVFGGATPALTGTTGSDTITDNSTPVAIVGLAGNDSITEGNTNVTINGGDGNDTIVATNGGGHILYGGAGTDSITGGTNANTLFGGSGNDTITGAAGADSLTGGTGADRFRYTISTESTTASRDIITDFSQSDGDLIDLSSISSSITWIGTSAFSSVANQARYYQSGGNTFLQLDTNGDGTVDLEIQLNGLITLTQPDVVGTVAPATLTGLLTDQNTAANQAASAWTFDASTAFGGGGTYSLTTTDQLGNTVTGYSINSTTGIITNTSTIANTTTAYIFTVTKTGGGTTVTENFDLFTNAGALTGASTTGNDTLTSTAGSQIFWGNSGNDSINGSSSNSPTIHGGDGNDTLSLFHLGIAYGGAGNDSISGGLRNTIYGGDGNDTISVATISASNNNSLVYGGFGTDSIIANGANDTLNGDTGNDTINGGLGGDALTGGTGLDHFVYNTIADSNTVNTYSDTIVDFSQSDGDKIVLNISDFTSIVSSGTATTVGQLEWNQSGGNTFVYDPFATNSNFSIRLTGLITLTSGDFIFGADGVTGGTGGNDTVSITAGSYNGLGGNDSLTGTTERILLLGGDGNDTIDNGGFSAVFGNAGDDSIICQYQNTVYGGDGNDTILLSYAIARTNNIAFGGNNNDSITASNGIDTLYGGSGNDTITGSVNRDSLIGGTGIDHFVFNSMGDSNTAFRDTITDFSQSDGDKIVLNITDFTSIVSSGTATVVGQLEWSQSGGNTFIYDPFATNSLFSIQLTGLITLTSGDFIFGSNGGVLGTAGNDTVTINANSYYGLDGADSINASGQEYSAISGGNGNDTINLGGFAVAFGGDGDDSILTQYQNTVYGGEGNDSISVSSSFGNSIVYGGNGNDSIIGLASNANDTLNGGSGADTITGASGADNIFAGSSDAAVDRIIYSATTDGASAGANTGYDTISEFEVGTDKIAFTSTVNTNFDDIGLDDTFAWVTNAAANFTTTAEGMLITGLTNANLTEASFTAILAALNGYGITAASGADAIIVAQGTSQTAFFLYTENGTAANNIVAAELTLLGISNGQLTTSDFIFA